MFPRNNVEESHLYNSLNVQFFILSFSFAQVSFCSTTKVFSKLYVTNLSFTQLFFENSNAEQFAIVPYLSIATAEALCMANWNSRLLFNLLLKRQSRVVSGLINSFVLCLVCLLVWFFQNNELKTCQNSYLGWGRTSRESKSPVIFWLSVSSAKLTVVVLAHASQFFFSFQSFCRFLADVRLWLRQDTHDLMCSESP